MKAEIITLCEKEFYLIFTGAAKFDMDKLCGDESVVDLTQPRTAEGRECLYKALAILAEQGELVRRYYGYDRGEILTATEIMKRTTPGEEDFLKAALYNAIARGYGREVQDDEKEIDLVLQEIEKKTVNR